MRLFVTTIAFLLLSNFMNAQDYQDHVINGDFEGEDLSCFVSKEWYDQQEYWGIPRVIEDPTTSGNHCAVMSTRNLQEGEETADSWLFQFFVTISDRIEVGDEIRLTMRIRADKSAECETQAHNMPGEYNYWNFLGNIDFTEQWQTVIKETVITSDQVYGSGNTAETSDKELHTIAFNLFVLQEANNYYFDDIKLEVRKPTSTSGWFNLIRNGIYTNDKILFGNNEFTTFTGRDGADGIDRQARIENDPRDGQPALVVKSVAASYIDGDEAHYIKADGEDIVLNQWQTQFFVTTRHVFHEGERMKFTFEARADHSATIGSEFHKAPADYLAWGILGDISLSENWQTFQYEKTINSDQDGGQTIALDLNIYNETDNTYYFRNIQLCINEADATDLDHVIGSKDVYLPVPEPDNSDAMRIPVDFSDCLQILERNDLKNLLSGKNMKVKIGETEISQESYSATSDISVNDDGTYSTNGTVTFHLEYVEAENKVYFVINKASSSFNGKIVRTGIYFENDGWYYAYNINFVDETNYRLDTYRTIGLEEIYLPVPEPENTDGARASIDFTNCLQTFETDEFTELISGNNMKVQESNGMLSQDAISATINGAAFNETGSYDENGTIRFKIDGASKDKLAEFHIYNNGESFIGRTLKTRICFDQAGKYYVFGITFVDEPTYRKLTNVNGYELSVVDEYGNPITNGIEIIWYDENGERIGTGSSLYGIKENTEVYYSVLLNEELGRKYREVIKQKVNPDDGESVTCQLKRIDQITLHGTVSAYGTVIPRAEVNLMQWLNGKYEYEASTMTDAKGGFTFDAYNDSTEIVVLANGYIDNKIVRRNLNNGGELGTIEMTEVSGKVVALELSYQEATKEGVEPIVQSWYSDTRNIDYSVYNETKGKAIEDFAIQQGNIVLPTGTDRGDNIRVTLRSLNEKFSEVTANGVIADNDTAKVSISLLAFGGIEATYGQKADDNLLAMLYDNAGKLQMRTICSTSRLSFTNLAAGNYTLVTMGYNGAIGSVSDISDLANMDLAEGIDYVRSTATVRDGIITAVNVTSVPELDASKFEYTGENTSFLPNKTQMVISNFITITTRLDFKEQYADQIHNAKIIVDIPDGCEYIAKSAVIGNKPLAHSLDGNRLTISLDEEDLDQRVRFCLYPTTGGTFLTSSIAEFDYKGTKTQPLGQVRFEATTGELYVPSTARTKEITVGGIGVPKADVEVYDNEALIGTTKSLGNGKWSLKCELNNAYNLSTHSIYVKYRGDGNVAGVTEAKDCFYDINAIVPKTVTMINTAHPAGNLTPKVYENVFDYETVIDLHNNYLYWPNYPDFTFLIDLSENDTTKVSDVTLTVYTTDGDKRKLPAIYDGNRNRFVATGSFDMYCLPVNVSVEYDSKTEILVDNHEFNDIQSVMSNCIDEYITSKRLIENIFSEDLDQEELERLLSTNNLNGEEVDALYTLNQINEMSVDELNYMISEYDNASEKVQLQLNNISDAIEMIFTYEKYAKFDLGDNKGLEIKNCDGITEELLLARGFEKLLSTDGNYIYLLSSDNESEMVNFSHNIYIIVNGSVSSIAFSKHRAPGDTFNKIIQDINYWFDKVRNTYNDFEKAFRLQLDEKIVNKLNASLKEANKILSQATTRLNMKNVKLQRLEKELSGMNSLTLEYALKQDEIAKFRKEVKEAQNLFNAAKKTQAITTNALKAVKPLYTFLTKANPAIRYASAVNDGLNLIKDYQRLYASIPEKCPNSNVDANWIRNMCISRATASGATLMAKIGTEAAMDMSIGTEILGTAVTGGASAVLAAATIAGKFIVGLAFDFAFTKADEWSRKGVENEIKNCKKKEKDDDKDKNPETDNKNGDIDPSGFVYEAVPTNRIEGVKATIYYSEFDDGAYQTQWDAAEFGQINPQITDESGLYAWDVPQGFWKVIFEKDGYETTQTEWLPVPPPQLEVNIPMSQAVAPYVENATGAESGITLDFSKYMKPNTLTKSKRVTVTVNGKNAGGDVELLNAEENPFNHEEYVSKIKFVPNTSFKTTDEVIITVKKEVESYAGKEMTEDFVQRVKIESEIKEIACDSVMAVDYQGTGVLEVSVLPAAAAKGKTIQVASTSTMIASTDAQSVTLNDEGKARIVVSGELPGNASLHLSMPEAGKEKYVTVNVVTKEEEVVKTPKASKLSGSEFENSYMLSLTCATKGATIYYTIDGSCPCDEQTRKKYTGPITLPEGQVTLQAIAVREGMTDSDIATYNYTVTKDASGIKVIEESRDFEADYQDGTIVITGAKGAICHIYDLQGRELAIRSHIGNQARINVPKTDIYVISITFANEQTVVHKIMAK